jgi:DNA-binding CsgD family transcriptional regulator
VNIENTLQKELDRITEEYRRAGSVAVLEPEIEKILSQSKEAKWAEGIARCLYLQSRVHESRREMKEAADLNLKAKKIAEDIGLETLRVDCDALAANHNLWNDKLREAYHGALNALASADTSGNHHASVFCSFILGTISTRYSSDDQALRYFHNALEGANQFGFLKLEAITLFKLAELFLSKLRFAEAERYARTCVAVETSLGVPGNILSAKIRLITSLIEAGKLDEAQKYIDEVKADQELLRTIDKGTLALCEGKIAQKLRQYDLSEKKFKRAIRIFTETERDQLVANAYAIFCELSLEQKNAASAVSYAKKTLQKMESQQNNYLQSQAYRLMYEASKLAKNTSNALKYLELYNERFTRQEDELLESRIQFIELNAEYQMKQAEINQERRQAKDLRIELEVKEQELTEKTRHLIKQTDVIAQFRDDLRAIIHRGRADDPLIREIKERLKHVSETAQTWDAFVTQFEAAHPAFLLNLEKKHPILSAMEKKICTLLRVGLTSTDIAKLLHLSDRNIENHRYRIRKKIALNTEMSLHEYLAAV